MPIIKFQCQSCGLLQRKRVRGVQSVDCPCGDTAYAEGSRPVSSIGFSSEVEGSMKAQTSGIESFDLDFDRVIGEESKQKWDTVYRRQRDKWDVLHQSDSASGYDIMRLPDGSYGSLPEKAKVFRENRQDNMRKIRTQNK
jgi:hypothetical protein